MSDVIILQAPANTIATEAKQDAIITAIQGIGGSGMTIPPYDTEERTYNLDGSIDTKVYKLDGVTVATLQYTYTDGILVSKQVI